MNKPSVDKILVVVLSIVVFITCGMLLFQNESEKTNEATGSKLETVLEAIHQRKSVRSFQNKPVSYDDLHTIVKAGMAAPTGVDRRPWEFIVLTDTTIIQNIRGGLEGTPAAIVVCGNMKEVYPKLPEFWITDTSLATQNMLLAIDAMGLGGVWNMLYPSEELMQQARETLNLPEHINPMCVVRIGYPKGDFFPKDKYNSEKIHKNGWGL